MAVLLDVQPGVLCGFTLYRDRRRPFSEHAISLLTGLTRMLSGTVRNCRAYEAATLGVNLLDQMHERPGAAYIVVDPPARERLRSRHAEVLLNKWFTNSDIHSSGLPLILVEKLAELVHSNPEQRLERSTWVRTLDDVYRVVKFVELPSLEGPRSWALLLHEIPRSIPLPEDMKRRLTDAQIIIAQAVLRSWTNEQIAMEFGLSIETVKTHIKNIFSRERLNCDNRADFIYQAAKLMRPI